MADIKKDIKHLRNSFRRFIERAGGYYKERNTKNARKDIYFYKERQSYIIWHQSYSSNNAIKKVIWELDNIVRMLGIFDEWGAYKNNNTLYMSCGVDDIAEDKSNVVILEEWKKVKDAAKRLDSNKMEDEISFADELTDDEECEHLFGHDGSTADRRFWLDVRMARTRVGGKGEIDDAAFLREIENDFMLEQKGDIAWEIRYGGMVSKSFCFEHFNLEGIKDLDELEVKQLHRATRVADTYNSLMHIIWRSQGSNATELIWAPHGTETLYPPQY